MDPIVSKDGMLPTDQKEARTLRTKFAHYNDQWKVAQMSL